MQDLRRECEDSLSGLHRAGHVTLLAAQQTVATRVRRAFLSLSDLHHELSLMPTQHSLLQDSRRRMRCAATGIPGLHRFR